jgi:hypothetical protein
VVANSWPSAKAERMGRYGRSELVPPRWR